MCKNFHIPCVCGIFIVSLRSLTLRLVTSRDPVAPGKLALRYALPARHITVSVSRGPQFRRFNKRLYERNYFSGRKRNSFVPPE